MVIVLLPDPDAAKDGLSTETIRTAAELRLRSAGIKVRPCGDAPKPEDASSSSFLVISVSTHKTRLTTVLPESISKEIPEYIKDGGLYACEIRIDLMQWCAPIRDSSSACMASTWIRGNICAVGSERLSKIKSYVEQHVDEFINDYLTANPKK